MSAIDSPPFSLYDPFAAGFERARQGVQTPWGMYTVPLDTAGSAFFNTAGDAFYADAASTGDASVDFNVQMTTPQAPMLCHPGFVSYGIFANLTLSWAAQPGRIFRFAVATGQRVVPASPGGQSITGWTAPQPVTVTGAGGAPVATLEIAQPAGAQFASSVILTANVPENAVPAAANVNGIDVLGAWAQGTQVAGYATISLLANAAAPTHGLDGYVIEFSTNQAAVWPGSGANQYNAALTLAHKAQRIPVGSRLDFVSNVTELGGSRVVLYTLL